MPVVLIHLVLALTLSAIPPLSYAQRTQLDSARDSLSMTDEGALYPLLRNALTWPDHVEAGATLPDYEAIQKDPTAYRGQFFLIEGILQRAKPIGKLIQPGPWDGRLTEWDIQWGDTPKDMLIVNLVDPPVAPRDGAKVRLAARFYKLWPTTTLKGQTKTFMVFVGKDARVLGVTSGVNGSGVAKSVVLVAVLAGICLFWVIRRAPKMTLQPKPTARQLRRRQQWEAQQEAMNAPSAEMEGAMKEDVFEAVANALRKDPAKALTQMSEAHENANESESDTTSPSDEISPHS